MISNRGPLMILTTRALSSFAISAGLLFSAPIVQSSSSLSDNSFDNNNSLSPIVKSSSSLSANSIANSIANSLAAEKPITVFAVLGLGSSVYLWGSGQPLLNLSKVDQNTLIPQINLPDEGYLVVQGLTGSMTLNIAGSIINIQGDTYGSNLMIDVAQINNITNIQVKSFEGNDTTFNIVSNNNSVTTSTTHITNLMSNSNNVTFSPGGSGNYIVKSDYQGYENYTTTVTVQNAMGPIKADNHIAVIPPPSVFTAPVVEAAFKQLATLVGNNFIGPDGHAQVLPADLSTLSTFNPNNAAVTLALASTYTQSLALPLDSYSINSYGALTDFSYESASSLMGSNSFASVCISTTCTNSGIIRWGAWGSGTLTGDFVSPFPTSIVSTNQFHYMVGVATSPSVIEAKTGTVVYAPFGGTYPTDNSGNSYNAAFGNLSVNFTEDTANLASYNLTKVGDPSPSYGFTDITFSLSEGTLTSNDFTRTGGMPGSESVSASGFFAGTNGDTIGMGLTVTDSYISGFAINGVESFNKQ